MNLDFLSLVVAGIVGLISALLIMLKESKSKAARLQREHDVNKINTDSKNEVAASDLKPLVDKLNSKIANDKRGH